jgi:sialic acid synthase SpsE
MKTIDVNGFEIGGSKTYIIADVGSNHMQDLNLAKESIIAAKESGADAVKFQSIQLNELYLNPDLKTANFVKKLEFPEDWHLELKNYSDKIGITFFSSPTYLKSVDLLESVNTPIYKLASAQVGTFPQIVEKVASLNKPTIFSTGIAAMSEIETAAQIFKKYNNDQFIILHCNSIYPTPADKVNLPLIKKFIEKYDNPIGFSDHTIGTHISCAAVAIGAKVIEKHFTLNRNFDAPDSNEFSSDPAEFSILVNQIRDVEKSIIITSDRSTIEAEEQEFKNEILYKIISSTTIVKGEIIKPNKLKFLRTKGGINCKEINKIVGRKLNQTIKENQIIYPEMLE